MHSYHIRVAHQKVEVEELHLLEKLIMRAAKIHLHDKYRVYMGVTLSETDDRIDEPTVRS